MVLKFHSDKIVISLIIIDECLIKSNVALISKCKTTLIHRFYYWSIIAICKDKVEVFAKNIHPVYERFDYTKWFSGERRNRQARSNMLLELY